MASPSRQDMTLYGDAPGVLLFADLPSRRAALRQIVEGLGGRIVAAAGLRDAVARLDTQVSIDAVVVDATAEEDAESFGTLVSRLDHAAEAGHHASVVIMPPEYIDIASACGWHPDVALLCAPERHEEAMAIGTALAQRRIVLSDVNADGATPRLRQLSEEVSRIARVLATMSGEEQPAALTPTRPEAPPPPPRRGSDAIVDAMQVRAMIRAPRLRELYFPADLFADPAWDMLLDLMAARLERRQVAVSSLCIAAAVPPTTALRWIKLLTDQGILIRIADPTDGRRVFIELSEQAAEGMMNYLAAAQRLAAIAS